MIQFLVHEKADNVGVATVDIKSGETARGSTWTARSRLK
jgi:(2R)-sulfolactate sulfo-lyase subunit alpha